MEVIIREYQKADLVQMTEIWNHVVEEGVAFPQLEPLDSNQAQEFFKSQSFTAVAEQNGEIVGLYVGRCGHLSNASYAVKSGMRGLKIGEKLVCHCLAQASKLGFRVLQFNAVVKTNERAIRLYKKLGFVELGTVPGGFLMKNGRYEDIILFYHTL